MSDYQGVDPFEAAKEWITIVNDARKLRPEQFDRWLRLVGEGDDTIRCYKGQQFLNMMRPTVTPDILVRLLKEQDK